VTRVAAMVKDLRRQIVDYKSDIIKLQDNLKARDTELAENARKVSQLFAFYNPKPLEYFYAR
jgi:hypothetical protein